ncbi:MAG TPA: s-methyl-5-thioribose-1-phosphate isomerase [Syntrophales bacterium]|nr:s-methyl-5-thioribose-1-phosphate isomerase [Syntrophales bacterium]
MTRADEGLPFLLRYENVADYRNGEIWILDRRAYPLREEVVRCTDYHEVAKAIADMVTQSGGPWLAAALGMVSAARWVRNLPSEKAKKELEHAADVLSRARPTTSANMRTHIQRILKAAVDAIDRGEDTEAVTYAYVLKSLESRYRNSRKMATYTVELLPDDVTILTHCYAETLIGFILLVSQERGKRISLICPETRPYLQGARLTASVAYDMGVPVTVITDNMPAYVLSKGMAQVFISAADLVTLDGHVVNKIGTFQIALAAHFHGVPYYALGTPSADCPSLSSVEIEERNPEETVHAFGVRTTKIGVKGYYPAFDITPPELVSAIITPKGVYTPFDLKRYYL